MQMYQLLFKPVFNKVIFFTWIVMLFSCSKEDDEIDVVYPVTGGGYLVKGIGLGEVSSDLVRLAMNSAGYPDFESYVKYSIKLYKIIYNTTYKGEAVLASGIISYPTGTTSPIPTMIVGPPLVFKDSDAPSEFKLPDNYTGFEFLACLGYVTVMPDMIGYGISKNVTFPISNYEYSANTMIDFLYAVKEFIEAKNLTVSNKTHMIGYSQGAYIALATLKMIQEKPIPDITIDATAIGAGGYNLVNILNYSLDLNLYTAPSHLILLFTSYNEIYEWGRPMSDFFQEPFAGRIPTLLNGQYDREEINKQLAYHLDSLLTPDFLHDLKNNNEPDVINALAENNIDDWAPVAKLNLIHSMNDDRIPFKDSEDTYNKMIANGADSVVLTPIDDPGHVNAGIGFAEMAVKWFNNIE